MYTDEEVLYHAFKISQTRDDQLMHRNTAAFQAKRDENRRNKDEVRKEKTKSQITTNRMNSNQNAYGNAKADAYKSAYNRSQYAKKYADPNDPWAKENSWKEERKNKMMSPKERNKTTYTDEDTENHGGTVGPRLRISTEAKNQYFDYLVKECIDDIPPEIDNILRDRAAKDPDFIRYLWSNSGNGIRLTKAGKQEQAEANMVIAYLNKIENEVVKKSAKRWEGNWGDNSITRVSDMEASSHGRQSIKQALKDKYGFR